ncbi:MAG: hypothetical protein N4A47_03845 [Clostridia bacterium]|nr:hypothetical protein [Clostridia bacterium]
MEFKFYWVGTNGQSYGLSPKKAVVERDKIIMDNEELLFDDVEEQRLEGKKLIIWLSNKEHPFMKKKLNDDGVICIEICKGDKKEAANSITSGMIEKKIRKSMETGEHVDVTVCPKCGVKRILENGTDTLIHCANCKSVYDERTKMIKIDSDKYGICDKTNLFGITNKYRMFELYFFLIYYSYSYGTLSLSMAHVKKNINTRLRNDIIALVASIVVGYFNPLGYLIILAVIFNVPTSIYLRIKAHKNLKLITDQKDKDLVEANTLMLKSDAEGAIKIYDKLLMDNPDNVGVKYNRFIAKMSLTDDADALKGEVEDFLKVSKYYEPFNMLW